MTINLTSKINTGKRKPTRAGWRLHEGEDAPACAAGNCITEGVRIHNNPGLSLNRRSEWKMPTVARVDIRRDVGEQADLRERQS